MAKSDDAMAAIVEKLIAQMEAGVGTWEMPWRQWTGQGWPTNAGSGREYTGGNVVVLMMRQLERGWTVARWATYQQWAGLGAQVRKGEKSTEVVLFKPVESNEESDNGGENSPADVRSKRRLITRVYHVFNAAQVDGWEAPVPPVVEPLEIGQRCQRWIDAIPHTVIVGKPCYIPSRDVVSMPPTSAFSEGDDWFSTYAHELAHWTGHESRLNREYGKRFGDHAYAMEELVAELSAAFTCTRFDVYPARRSDHASYLRSWVAALRADPGILWSVAAKAESACQFLSKYSTPEVPAVSEELHI